MPTEPKMANHIRTYNMEMMFEVLDASLRMTRVKIPLLWSSVTLFTNCTEACPVDKRQQFFASGYDFAGVQLSSGLTIDM